MATDPPKLETPLQATLAGIRDRFGGGPKNTLRDSERLDGKTVLLTGANRGLGFGIAQRLAERGASLLLACRSQGAEAVDRLRALGHSTPMEAVPLDLASPASVAALVDLLARHPPLDRVVLNAGIVPLESRQTPSGLDVMFHVNFLGNVDLTEQLVAAGRLAPAARVVVVSSESHRTGQADLDHFAEPPTYGTSGVMTQYGTSKLYLTAWASALARTLPADQATVHTLCPGAVASDIAREAPAWMQVLLTPTMKLLFASPTQAAAPVEWLCCTTELATGSYHHMHQAKPPAALATDPDQAAAVRAAALDLLETIR